MTNEEIQKLMEFIITQQAQITTNQAEITLKQLDFEKKQALIMDIHFETASRQAEFEKAQAKRDEIFDNKLSALLDWQAKFSEDLEDLKKETKEINNNLKTVTNLAVETSDRVDKLEEDNKS